MNLQEYAKDLSSKFGFNIVPMLALRRDENGKKVPKLLPNWDQYKAKLFDLDRDWSSDYSALSIITGKISNLTILDIDSEPALSTLLTQLNLSDVTDLAEYVMKTTKGYQLFYQYDPHSRTRIAVKDHLDFLNGGLTFAVETNKGYTTLKNNPPAQIPTALKAILLDDLFQQDQNLEETKKFEEALRENSILPYIKPLSTFITDQFLPSKRISKPIKARLEQMFCSKHYKNKTLSFFAQEGSIHDTMLYVAGIVASDPTVNKDTYHDFMIAWAQRVAKIDMTDPREQELVKLRIQGGLNYFCYDENWGLKNREQTRPQAIANHVDCMVWRDIEDEKYIIYEPNEGRKVRLRATMFKEQLNFQHLKKHPNTPLPPIDLNLIEDIEETFDPTVNDSFFYNEYGRRFFNTFRKSKYLSYFQTCDPKTEPPHLIGKLLNHLFPKPEEKHLFLSKLAYHMEFLVVAPTCWVLTGSAGTGKNLLFQDILGEIYDNSYEAMNLLTFSSRFRNRLKNKLLVFIDEVNEKRQITPQTTPLHNLIKQQVSNPTLSIETKGKNEQVYPHHSFYLLASNLKEPFRLEDSAERRICISSTRPENLRTLEWFPSHLHSEEVRKTFISEIPEFLQYLRSFDLRSDLFYQYLDNSHRELLIDSSKSHSERILEGILTQNSEPIHEVDSEIGDWYDDFLSDNLRHVSLKKLKEVLGSNLYNPLIKKLKEVFELKKIDNIRSIVINPKGKNLNDFERIEDEF